MAKKKKKTSPSSRHFVWYALTIVVSVVFGWVYDPPAQFTKKELLRSLNGAASAVAPRGDLNFALGFNANVDVVVSAIALLRECGIEEASESVDHETLRSASDLSGVFRHFLATGSAGERGFHLADPSAADAFAKIERCVRNIPGQTRVGGNAAIMAVALFEKFGANVLIGGQVGDLLDRLLPSSIKFVAAASGATVLGNTKVNVQSDEPHIILEYGVGAKWGGESADRANRFIVSRDDSNSALASAEPFFAVVKRGKGYDAVVLAGIHMLDGRKKPFQHSRLSFIKKSIDKIKSSTALHLELASIGEEDLVKQIAWYMLPSVDSLGLNEMELSSLYTAVGGKDISPEKLALSNPEPSDVYEAIAFIFGAYEAESRVLSRIHFHCLGFHVIATRELDASSKRAPRIWPNSAIAVASGSVAATLKGCDADISDLHGNDLDVKRLSFKFRGALQDVDQALPVAVHEMKSSAGTITFSSAPVVVCRRPKSTVGLGDLISATGLAHQL